MKGFVPQYDFFDLQRSFSNRYGYDYNDVVIAKYFRATLCLTTSKNSEKWRRTICLFFDTAGRSIELPDSMCNALSYKKTEKVIPVDECAYIRGRSNTV